MTETQNPRPDHRAPLAPGEIRTHTVGAQRFQVMHVAGGSFTQASYRDTGGFATVIATERFEDAAVRAYADAIEQAESDAIDELDDADGSMFISSSTGELIDPQATPAPDADLSFNLPMGADMQLVTGGRPTTAPSFADDVAALRELAILSDRYGIPKFVAALDRIAAQVPMRARVGDELWWMHSCGAAGLYYPRDIAGVTCTKCNEPGDWRALYTFGGA